MLGAICGDVLGSTKENNENKYDNVVLIPLFEKSDHITDDSVLTCAVADWLLHDINKDFYCDDYLRLSLAKRFVQWTRWSADIEMSYGNSYVDWFFRAERENNYDPVYSCGNGSAMRVSPVGWYFDTLEETLRFAKLSADVTHNHPEGEKGAMAIAASVFLARKGYKKTYIKDFILRAFGYEKIVKSAKELRDDSRWVCTCQETVPLAIVAFLESTDYESAIRLAISFGCDADTVACMAGAIAEAYYKHIPKTIEDFCQKQIPQEVVDIVAAFNDAVDVRGWSNW